LGRGPSAECAQKRSHGVLAIDRQKGEKKPFPRRHAKGAN